MSYGPYRVFDCSFASGSTFSTYVDLGRAWGRVWLDIPTMASVTSTTLLAACAADQTYRKVRIPVINTATADATTFMIHNTASDNFIILPNGLRYMKFEVASAQTDPVTFKIVCGD